MTLKPIAWMWFEGFGLLPGSPWNSTTDPEVRKAMAQLGFEIVALIPATKSDETRYANAKKHS